MAICVEYLLLTLFALIRSHYADNAWRHTSMITLEGQCPWTSYFFELCPEMNSLATSPRSNSANLTRPPVEYGFLSRCLVFILAVPLGYTHCQFRPFSFTKYGDCTLQAAVFLKDLPIRLCEVPRRNS